MCEPTLAMAGIQGVRSVAQINSQNSASRQNAANATAAANTSYDQEALSFSEQSRSLVQGAFDAILMGREAESLSYTSAIENGVQGNSVKNMMRTLKQKTGRTKSRFEQEQESLETQTGLNMEHIQTGAQGRINSVPTTSFGLGDILSIATPIVRGQME